MTARALHDRTRAGHQLRRGLLALGMLFVAGVSLAGEKSTRRVSLYGGPRGGLASGSLGSALSSDDMFQYIRCRLSRRPERDSIPSATDGYCYASDGTSTVMCHTIDLDLVRQIEGIDALTVVTFMWDGNGACTTIYLDKSSAYEPPGEVIACSIPSGGPR